MQVRSFFIARNIFQKFRVFETTQKKSLQKHLKNGICWKGNAIIQLSHVLQGEVVQAIFSYLNIYTDGLVSEFPVLEHLCSISVHFKKASHISRQWKLTEF